MIDLFSVHNAVILINIILFSLFHVFCSGNNELKSWISVVVAGLRKVYPYHYAFTTHAKGRWVNQRIIDVFTKEFRHDTPENYVNYFLCGMAYLGHHWLR